MISSIPPTHPASLSGRRILLGIGGGIAACKADELVRRLRDLNSEVQVVTTAAGARFVSELSLQTLSGRRPRSDLFDAGAEQAMGHIELARWAELILIAPATANLIARLRAGLADDLLTTLCLASEAPVALAPAMNQRMWHHPATRENLAVLCQRGVQLWGPDEGRQACGDQGPGRMLEPAELVARIGQLLQPVEQRLAGRHCVITAGPTREALDPVRYLSNHSSGRMGFAMATAAAAAGARVTLIAGPVALPTPIGVERLDVQTALEMHEASLNAARDADLFIAVAAVADYRPQEQAEHKIKKQDEAQLTLRLIPNPDILAEVAAIENPPFTVGFAAETRQLLENARDKLRRKGVNMIIANQVGGAQGGFASEDNAVTLVSLSGYQEFALQPKEQLARLLIDHIAAALPAGPGLNTRAMGAKT